MVYQNRFGNKFIAAIRAPRNFGMIFYNLLLVLKSTSSLNRNKHDW